MIIFNTFKKAVLKSAINTLYHTCFCVGATYLFHKYIFSNTFLNNGELAFIISALSITVMIKVFKRDSLELIKEERLFVFANYAILIFLAFRLTYSPYSHYPWLTLALLIVLAILNYKNFFYAIPTFFLALNIFKQEAAPFSSEYDSTDMWILINFNIIYFSYVLKALVIPRKSYDSTKESNFFFVLFLLSLMSGYFLAGHHKIIHGSGIINYVTTNTTANMLQYYYLSPISPVESLQLKRFLFDVSLKYQSILNAIVLCLETLTPFLIVSLPFFCISVFALVFMHIGLWSCGFLFWKWIVFDLLFLHLFLTKKEIFNSVKWKYLILFSFLVFIGRGNMQSYFKKIFFIDGLGWYDGDHLIQKQERIAWHFLDQNDVSLSLVNPSLFYPFEKSINQSWNHWNIIEKDPASSKELDNFFKHYSDTFCANRTILLNHFWNLEDRYPNQCEISKKAKYVALVKTEEDVKNFSIQKSKTIKIMYRYQLIH